MLFEIQFHRKGAIKRGTLNRHWYITINDKNLQVTCTWSNVVYMPQKYVVFYRYILLFQHPVSHTAHEDKHIFTNIYNETSIPWIRIHDEY